MLFGLLESLPITGIFVLVSLLMLASFEIGYRFGDHAQSHRDEDAPSSLGPMVGGLLGMLGFVLAFTFSMAAAQHDLRKQIVVDDANTIGTAYLRADLLDDTSKTAVQNLLREYVDIRLRMVSTNDRTEGLARTGAIQRLLWKQAAAAARMAPDTNTALMVQAVNDVLDVHEKRVAAALRTRIPGSAWIALSAITLLTMVTMGIQVGLTGKRRLAAVIPLSLAFAVLVTLVVDLNRPQNGLIKVSQESMIGLQASMRDTGN
ncbi:MAG: hypothetical protein KIS75_14000 [Chromatiales bacterium]|nr:hypothetical protein [Chromatiales bacterium]